MTGDRKNPLHPQPRSSGLFAQGRPQSAPPPIITPFDTAATAFVTGSTVNPVPPHTFPYLVDRFFYTGASGGTGLTTARFGVG